MWTCWTAKGDTVAGDASWLQLTLTTICCEWWIGEGGGGSEKEEMEFGAVKNKYWGFVRDLLVPVFWTHKERKLRSEFICCLQIVRGRPWVNTWLSSEDNLWHSYCCFLGLIMSWKCICASNTVSVMERHPKESSRAQIGCMWALSNFDWLVIKYFAYKSYGKGVSDTWYGIAVPCCFWKYKVLLTFYIFLNKSPVNVLL